MAGRIRNILHYIYHVIIKREALPFYEAHKFKSFGQNVQISKPLVALDGTKYMSIGNDCKINKYARMQCYTQENQQYGMIELGERCYIGYRFTVLSGPDGVIKIGNDVLIASDVIITNENHGMDPESELQYMDQPLSVSSVEIGDGCWIGEKVCIMPGVIIGKKSIIGAGSIVTHDVPAYSIAVGNPAKIIKTYDFNNHKWIKVKPEVK